MGAVFYNGEFCDYESARIPLSDRSVFFGDGVYDVVIGKGNFLYLLDEHLERFYRNIGKIGLLPFCDRDTLTSIIMQLVKMSDCEEYLLYMQASGSSPTRVHARTNAASNLLVFITPYIVEKDFLPVRLRTAPDLRGNMCDVKSINLLPAVLASSESRRLGLDETVYVRCGTVTECAHSSLAIVKGGVLYTHPLTNAILPSITRKRSLSLLRDVGIRCEELPFGKEALYSADEVIVMSTTKLCRWACEVDGIRFSRKKMRISEILSKKLLKDYQNL